MPEGKADKELTPEIRKILLDAHYAAAGYNARRQQVFDPLSAGPPDRKRMKEYGVSY